VIDRAAGEDLPGLDALVEEPEDLGLEEEGEAGAASGEWAGPYLKDGEIPRDPWGNELRYEPLEQTEGVEGNRPPFRVWSLGPDGQDGTEDDIANWSEES